MNSKHVILAFTTKELEDGIKLAKKLVKDPNAIALILGSGYTTPKELRNVERTTYQSYYLYATDEVEDRAYEEAKKLTSSTCSYLSSHIDSMEIRVVVKSLWSEMFNFFYNVIKTIEIIKRTLKTTEHDIVHIMNDQDYFFLWYLSSSFGQLSYELCKKLRFETRTHTRFVDTTLSLLNRSLRPIIEKTLMLLSAILLSLNEHLTILFSRRRQHFTENPKICFIIQEINQSKNLLPVALKLIKKGFSPLLVDQHPQPFTNLKDIIRSFRLGSYSRKFELYLSMKALTNTYKATKALRKEVQGIKQHLKSTVNYEGIQIWKVYWTRLDYLFSTRIPELLLHFNTMKNLLSREKPHVVLVGDDKNAWSAITVNLAKFNNSFTIDVDYGVTPERIEPTAVIADLMVLPGEKFKKIYMKYRTPTSEKYLITGQPLYDKVTKVQFKKQETLQKLKIRFEKVILFASQPVHQAKTVGFTLDMKKDALNGLLNLAKELPDVGLIVKLHPIRDDKKLIHQVFSKARNVTIIGKADILELINASDIVVTIWSTTAVESLLFKKPVIILNFWPGFTLPTDYVECGAFLVAKDAKTLASLAKDVLDGTASFPNEQAVSQYLQQLSYKVDGHSADRIAALALEKARRMDLNVKQAA